jgi:glyoxylase-like metal-dependent hydrolase (beta-lactamase superfamily II)
VNIHTLDLNFQNIPHNIASYLIVGSDGPILIETGPGATLPALHAALNGHGFTPGDVRHVLVTHIHLDHAGAAGWWAQHGAQVYVHHVGAPHLIDPSKLLASAKRIYLDKMDMLWGEMLPAPAERVTALRDGDRIDVAGLSLIALDTPGHAYHHFVYRLGDVAFSGDAAGIRVPNNPVIAIPAPPPEFDLEAWRNTLARLKRENFGALYPTHFGRVDNVVDHLDAMSALLEQSAEFVRRRMQSGMSREALIREYEDWQYRRAEAAGVSAAATDELNKVSSHYISVDGLMRYWSKRGVGQRA